MGDRIEREQRRISTADDRVGSEFQVGIGRHQGGDRGRVLSHHRRRWRTDHRQVVYGESEELEIGQDVGSVRDFRDGCRRLASALVTER